jgi:uncharacterized protein YdeI (BOF family)
VPAKGRAQISTKPIVVTMGEERSELYPRRHEQSAIASFAKASKEKSFGNRLWHGKKQLFRLLGITISLCALLLIESPALAALVPPEQATAPVPEVPVGALRSSFPPKGAVWVRAIIVTQADNDLYLIKDRTGEIALFLPSDKLLSLDLHPGMEILVLGTVDVSPVTPEKNEFYAQRILLPPKANLSDNI